MAGTIDPIGILARTLDALALRQQVTASNVANADTPGFRAQAVRFEEVLQSVLTGRFSPLPLTRTDPRHLTVAPLSASTVQPEVVQASGTRYRNDGNNVDIEQQMGLLAETTLRYSAVSEVLARRLAMLRAMASGGQGG
ncbi:MAG: flagellar basal body rod protein FlgB [Thermomicrobium sp.]|nr:flagellar basal body rod protein FlgB [Thermomicrobium sp.]